jgi:hypothetical protein
MLAHFALAMLVRRLAWLVGLHVVATMVALLLSIYAMQLVRFK